MQNETMLRIPKVPNIFSRNVACFIIYMQNRKTDTVTCAAGDFLIVSKFIIYWCICENVARVKGLYTMVLLAEALFQVYY